MAICEKLAQQVNKDMKRIRGESKPQGYIAIRTEAYWTAIAFEDYLRAKEKNVKQVKN
jgi:hypothetical protein